MALCSYLVQLSKVCVPLAIGPAFVLLLSLL